MQTRRVAIVEGFRTPFTRVFTDFAEMTAIDLAKVVLAELVNRTEIDPEEIDEIAMGISIPKPTTSNLARIAALGIGLPKTINSYHMQLACASSILTTAHVAMSIATGNADVGIAGGAESMSDVPITVTESSLITFAFTFDTSTAALYLPVGTLGVGGTDLGVNGAMVHLPPSDGTSFSITVDGVTTTIPASQMEYEF